MPIPETQPEHADLIAFMTEACKDLVSVETEDGKYHMELVLNTDKVYYKTQSVNYPGFSRFVLELENYKGMASRCIHHMAKARAKVMSDQIMAYVNSFKLSIDAKSSESLRDKDNTQQTLIDKLIRNKIERSVTFKGDVQRSIWEGLVGKSKNEAAGQD